MIASAREAVRPAAEAKRIRIETDLAPAGPVSRRSSRAPLLTPRSRWWKKIGCVSRAFEPHRTITSVSSISRYELVPPPAAEFEIAAVTLVVAEMLAGGVNGIPGGDR